MPSSHDAPPATLDRALEVGPDDWQGPAFYQLMTALVVPRPVGWISTISQTGVHNVAPYSYFNLMGSDPPYVAFGSTGVKDSLTNLRDVPEFVANIVTMHLLERMNFTSGDFPHEEDEFDWAGLTAVPAAKVRPFRVAEAKAHLECEVAQIVTDRNTNIVLGRIVHAHVDASVWRNGPPAASRWSASAGAARSRVISQPLLDQPEHLGFGRRRTRSAAAPIGSPHAS
jgi:flavin reductase (DIM6/NTAB) family NADH-FMN oxidoreductase RutF